MITVILRRRSKHEREQTIFQTSIVARISVGVTACVKKPGFCAQPAIIDDGEFRTVEVCRTTAANIEGPFYITDAPERNNFRLWEDEGVAVSLTGRVVEGDCSSALDGAIIEFWHANPSGDYDNDSPDMRYRGACKLRRQARIH